MPGPVARADDLQRRRRVLGFPVAVVYKFFDDQGNYLAAVLTYYAFMTIFPLLLIASSVLGFLLQGNPQLEETILSSALGQFPIVGTQLGRPEGLQGSASAVVVGVLASLYGITNLGQAAQNTLNVTWGVPRNSRLNPVRGRLRSLALLVLGGVAVLVVAVLPTLFGRIGLGEDGVLLRVLSGVASVTLSAMVLAGLMKLASADRKRLRQVLPGASVISLLWHVLQWLGGVYVSEVINRASQMNSVFALVLGLFALIYVASVIGVLGIEVNVVWAKRLFPRALLTPFTDEVELTEADRRVYTEYAQAQRHKGFEKVTVTFDQRE